MNELKVIGYYLCQPVAPPPFLAPLSKSLISVSGCIGTHHPIWECLFGCWLDGEEEEYMATCQLDCAQMESLKSEAYSLFEQRRLDVDSRFSELSDAQYFMRTYFSHIDCRLICLATSAEWLGRLEEELAGSQSRSSINGGEFTCEPIGCDILGWDVNGFHSFLCNNLHKGDEKIRFNDLGLLDMPFSEVEQLACDCQGYGEPVLWVPCRIGLYE